MWNQNCMYLHDTQCACRASSTDGLPHSGRSIRASLPIYDPAKFSVSRAAEWTFRTHASYLPSALSSVTMTLVCVARSVAARASSVWALPALPRAKGGAATISWGVRRAAVQAMASVNTRSTSSAAISEPKRPANDTTDAADALPQSLTLPLSTGPLTVGSAATGGTQQMNLFTAVNDALRIALQTDDSAVVFGEDVAFGGVFRCTQHLRDAFGPDRVFNTPLCEQGIAGFGIGLAASGVTAVAEIQFADYSLPAYDQLANEAAKFRYRSGGAYSAGLTVRMPCGAVGHGGLYHSQSPEALYCATPGLKVVMPRDPVRAKGLLLASIRDANPVIFMEPKALYRASVAPTPVEDYELPLGVAETVVSGRDVTLVGWGAQVHVLVAAAARAAAEDGISAEVLDLQTLCPWDVDAVVASVKRTGRLVVSHEAPLSGGLGGEVAATVAADAFLSLEAPVKRVCGWDTPFPLAHEKYYVPNVERCLESIKEVVTF